MLNLNDNKNIPYERLRLDTNFDEIESAVNTLTDATFLKEFYLMYIASNQNYMPMTIQDGLVGGKKHYANTDGGSTIYNDIAGQWEFYSDATLEAFITSVSNTPPSGDWTLTAGGTINIYSKIFDKTSQEFLEEQTSYNFYLVNNTAEYNEITLQPSDILTLGTSSIELLPAPGAGKYYDIEKIIFEFNYDSGFAYNDMAGDYFEIRYNAGGEKAIGVIDGNLISQAVKKVAIFKESTFTDNIAYDGGVIILPSIANTQIHLGTYNYANLTDNTQTATMKIKMWYKIQTIS